MSLTFCDSHCFGIGASPASHGKGRSYGLETHIEFYLDRSFLLAAPTSEKEADIPELHRNCRPSLPCHLVHAHNC
jgi:hypothetical protein